MTPLIRPSPAAAPISPDATSGTLLARPARDRGALLRRSRRLFGLGISGLVAGLVYFTYNAQVPDPVHLYLGQAMLVLSVLPSLLWARRAHYGLPLFEAFMLTGLTTYAIPLLGGHQALRRFDHDTIATAAAGVVLFQIVANLAYLAARARPQQGAFWHLPLITRDLPRYLGLGMALTTAYTAIILFTTWVPVELEGLVRAIAYGIGIVATFIQCRRWGQNALPPTEKLPFIIMLLLQVVFSWAALFLIGGVSILLLGLLGYVSGGKKIPFILLVLVLPVIAILHNGKSTMRLKYWEGRATLPTFTTLPAFFSEWIGYGLDPEIKARSEESNHLLERTSLFHIMCLVVSVTPERQPYLSGQTYAQIPAQFVPRFFWPEKPPGHISTNTLAIYYGLQRPEDTVKTTIAFGLLTEAYANFGFLGLGLLGALIGSSFKIVGAWASESPILSYGGMLMVVLVAWSFQTEFTLSIWLSSLVQGCVAVLGLPFLLRKLFP